jgi:hypothetical protein
MPRQGLGGPVRWHPREGPSRSGKFRTSSVLVPGARVERASPESHSGVLAVELPQGYFEAGRSSDRSGAPFCLGPPWPWRAHRRTRSMGPARWGPVRGFPLGLGGPTSAAVTSRLQCPASTPVHLGSPGYAPVEVSSLVSDWGSRIQNCTKEHWRERPSTWPTNRILASHSGVLTAELPQG